VENRDFSLHSTKFFLHKRTGSVEKTASLFLPKYEHCCHPIMKFPAFLLSVVAALGVSAHAQIPIGPNSIKLGRLAVAAVNTPEFQITGGANKRYETKKWIEIEISYDVLAEEIDELNFKFTAQIEGKLLDGDVTYVNITKGKEKFAVVYISPKSIDKLTKGKPLTGASIGNVWVEVNRQGQVLGKESKEKGVPPNAVHVAGMILNKSLTPFAPLYYDRYEEIKSTR
jgi:hypothetical protein